MILPNNKDYLCTKKMMKEKQKEEERKKKTKRKRTNKNLTGCCIHSIGMLYNNNLVDHLKILWITSNCNKAHVNDSTY